jgi:CRISPR-associated endonuclease/helicase Cas3
MMVATNLFLAKSNPEKTIREHTDEVFACYLSLKQTYPDAFTAEMWKAIETAIFCHDLGKINYRFQNMLYKALQLPQQLPDVLKASYSEMGVDQIPHGILSLLYLDYENCFKMLGEKMALGVLWAICLHHNRKNLMTLLEKAEFIAAIIREDLMKSGENIPIKGELILESPDENNHYRLDETQLTDSSQWLVYARIKGILNRADYAASGGLETIEIDPLQDGLSIAQIVRNKLPGLREVQQFMDERQEKNLIVVAATGIGKTEAALLWNGGRKLFYTLPLRVSINAIYERIKNQGKDGETTGYGYVQAELLHSDALTYYLKEAQGQESCDVSPFIRYQQARILASPLTVCTVDQLFKFVFKCNGYEAMFATLAYSNVVIDEMQMYSPSILACILYGLKLIQEAGGRFAIITATFPKILLDFFDELNISLELPKKLFQRDDLKGRHRIALRDGEIDVFQIIEAAKTKKVLVIVNTVKKAQTMYREILEKSGMNAVTLLHSNFIARDRRCLEQNIVKFAPGVYTKRTDNQPGIWICTQVVEASLDIDFDILFTEMSIVDSILQRMGRCYRQRNYCGLEPNVIIYASGNGIGKRSVYGPDMYDFSLKSLRELLQKYAGQMFTETIKQEYIDLVYDPNKNSAIRGTNYYKEIQERLSILKNLRPLSLEQRVVDDKFRDIKSISLIPDAIYIPLQKSGQIDRWEKALNNDRLKKEERAALLSEINEYVVNVRWHPKLEYDRREELFFKGSGIHRSRLKYDFNEGRGLGLLTDQVEVDQFL